MFLMLYILHLLVARRLYRHFRQFQWRQEYLILRKEDMDLSTFELSTIAKATNNFSIRNKLGEGGFGPVYKVKYPYLMYNFIFSKTFHNFSK